MRRMWESSSPTPLRCDAVRVHPRATTPNRASLEFSLTSPDARDQKPGLCSRPAHDRQEVTMYGTVAKTRVKPENRDKLGEAMARQTVAAVPGFVAAYMLFENDSDTGVAVRRLRGSGILRPQRRRSGSARALRGVPRPHGRRSGVARRGDQDRLKRDSPSIRPDHWHFARALTTARRTSRAAIATI